MDYLAAYDLTAVFRGLAFLNVLVLMVLFVIISAARRRQERVEKKIDQLLILTGEADFLARIDKEYGRESGFVPLG